MRELTRSDRTSCSAPRRQLIYGLALPDVIGQQLMRSLRTWRSPFLSPCMSLYKEKVLPSPIFCKFPNPTAKLATRKLRKRLRREKAVQKKKLSLPLRIWRTSRMQSNILSLLLKIRTAFRRSRNWSNKLQKINWNQKRVQRMDLMPMLWYLKKRPQQRVTNRAAAHLKRIEDIWQINQGQMQRQCPHRYHRLK